MITQVLECQKHGVQESAFVCQHTLDSMYDGIKRGLHLWRDEAGTNGWCDACDAAVLSGAKPRFDVKLLCLSCFEAVKDLNGGGDWDA